MSVGHVMTPDVIERRRVGQLATKSDLADLRSDMRTEIEAVRGDFKALNGKVNLQLAFNTPLVLAVLALPCCGGPSSRARIDVSPWVMVGPSSEGR